MSSRVNTVVGIGELLWDMLPTGAQLGGAPANFAYVARLLGHRAIPVSRVGNDALGDTAICALRERGLDVSHIQTDAEHATGTVLVSLDSAGQPNYSIVESVAWDCLAWTPALERLASEAGAVCFGTLAQRSDASRSTISKFLAHTRPQCLRVCDVNLRQHYYSLDLLRRLLNQTTVLKLSQDELSEVLRAAAIGPLEPVEAARRLQAQYNFELVCITRGANGSVLASAQGVATHPGIAASVVDTVGAGDAFAAAVTHQLLLGNSSLESIGEYANRWGAWVTSRQGAMPAFQANDIFQPPTFEVAGH